MAWLHAITLLVACGESHPGGLADGGVELVDSGRERDAGRRDAPASDGGGETDAGPADDELDSDGDTIADRHEGDRDPDHDGVPNLRDLDSDADGVSDAEEAGDADLATPPVECELEIDPFSQTIALDGVADAYDVDSDNDGVDDAAEHELGTNACSADTDGDGFADAVEVVYSRLHCPDRMTGEACDCATNPACGVPSDDVFAVLPYLGAPEVRQVSIVVEAAAPVDVTTRVSDEPGDPDGVDATRFVKRRRPACDGDTTCWIEPEGVAHDDAVRSVDATTFFGVAPGTTVILEVTLQNDFVTVCGGESQTYFVWIELTAVDGTRLERRLVTVLVPSWLGPC